MPRHAKIADKFTLIRSVAHGFADHGGGHKRFLTGRKPKTPTGFVNDAPAVGSIVAKMKEHRNIGLPNYVTGAANGRHGIDVYSFGSAYLGNESHPLIVPGDPSDEKFKVQNIALAPELSDRLGNRAELLRGFDKLKQGIDASGVMDAVDKFQGRAVDLLKSDKERNAFDLSQESESLRERYGKHAWDSALC